MKKLLIGVSLTVMGACNEARVESASTGADSTTNYAYPASYSSDFSIGSSKHVETIMSMWTAWDRGDLSASAKYLADTISMYFSDGTSMVGARDSLLKEMQGYRNLFRKMESRADAYMPLHSNNKDEDWVGIWGTEISTDMMGNVDSVYTMETWRFDKEGKVNLLFQYTREPNPKPQQ